MSYYNKFTKIDGNQKTAIILVSIAMVFLYLLITLPPKNVGVYMHSTIYNWAVFDDSTGVALEIEDVVVKEKKPYHYVLMERSNGEDNHIQFFAEDDFESAKALYLELRQLEIDNKIPEADAGSVLSVLICGFLSGILLMIFLARVFPEFFKKIVDYLHYIKSNG